MKITKRVTKLLTRKKKTSTTTKALVGAGATLAVAGAVGAALKIASDKRKAKAGKAGAGGAAKAAKPAPRAKPAAKSGK